MSNLAINAQNLGKMYRIGETQERYQTFRDVVTRAMTAPFRRMSDLLRGQAYGAAGLQEEIWALKDVTFDVKHGEVVGIIGRNGAGKSTLLKVLSRITEPTEGSVDLYGRVAALLEVGTGFHMELTGRENIYLNGAILGMKRKEIDRKFDEIVDFAGVERFIDTPVKHYSSGMGLRLGFAVAAHLEPEILVVDEVLAVGDAEFQKKCLGKMSQVAGEGRTVLFVSHNMAAVSNLCTRVIVLKNGQIDAIDETEEAINHYLINIATPSANSLANRVDRQGSGIARFTNVSFIHPNGGHWVSGDPASILVEYEADDDVLLEDVIISVKVMNYAGQNLFLCSTHLSGLHLDVAPTTGKLVCHLARIPLLHGLYKVNLWCSVKGQVADFVQDADQFTVVEGDYFGSGKLPVVSKHGEFLVEHSWELCETIPEILEGYPAE